MTRPKKDKTAITLDVVKEINDFAKTTLTEADLKAYNLHCFSDAGLGVHTCNPLAPMSDGSPPPDDEESYCSLHHICAVHLGARYGVGLADDEPYDFDKSKEACKKLGYDTLVKAIREKQLADQPAVEEAAAEPVAEEKSKPAASAEAASAAVKVRPRRLQKSPEAVLTVAKATKITDDNVKAAEAKPAKKAAAKSAKKAKKAKKAIKVIKTIKKAAKPAKKAASKPAKAAKVKKPVKASKVAKKAAKPAKKAPPKLTKSKAQVKKVEKAGTAQRRGRPRTREYDPSIHCPVKKPAYWRSIGAVKTWTPDHKLSVDEVKERLRTVGFRADTGSRMGVLLDAVKVNGGATLESLQKSWEKHDFKLQPLTHILRIAVKSGAFAMKGEKYVLGGHA